MIVSGLRAIAGLWILWTVLALSAALLGHMAQGPQLALSRTDGALVLYDPVQRITITPFNDGAGYTRPRWSPDGSSLLIFSDRADENRRQTHLYRWLPGGRLEALSGLDALSGFVSAPPEWSADGQQIALLLFTGDASGRSHQIFTYTLLDDALFPLSQAETLRQTTPFAWTADGAVRYLLQLGSLFALEEARPGEPPQRLRTWDTVFHSSSGAALLSPDAARFAIAARLTAEAPEQVFLFDLDSGGIQRLSDSIAAEIPLAWSPDGQWLLLKRRTAGNALELVITEVATHTRHNLLRANEWPDWPQGTALDIAEARWSPDRQQIAFFRRWLDRSGRSIRADLCLMSTAGGAPDCTHGSAWNEDAAWKP